MIGDSGWDGKVVPAYRHDVVVNLEFDGFAKNAASLGEITGYDFATWRGYLAAHRQRRAFFKEHGATSTDHGHPTARTEDLPPGEAAALFAKTLQGRCTGDGADAFRGQMLTEMARTSRDDGLVLQIHPGSFRNHCRSVLAVHGRDRGFDTLTRNRLRPRVEAVPRRDGDGASHNNHRLHPRRDHLRARVGAYLALKLGPPWWFFDSPEGIRRFREATTETCGYNTVGFNDDTRAFCSIPHATMSRGGRTALPRHGRRHGAPAGGRGT